MQGRDPDWWEEGHRPAPAFGGGHITHQQGEVSNMLHDMQSVPLYRNACMYVAKLAGLVIFNHDLSCVCNDIRIFV